MERGKKDWLDVVIRVMYLGSRIWYFAALIVIVLIIIKGFAS